ncbi:hypothetical protein CEXT_681891 [Caerostris extrusa]|uniref:Uncharacterized protein n=1 Tax=Caerostris extrusa TaxID=172846 RepID=A0AAV4XJH4_CAEEX|nr:hypothetical protein CEXT_681891 [Caerostris extrusa]
MEEVIPGSCGCSILEIVKENGNDEAIFGKTTKIQALTFIQILSVLHYGKESEWLAEDTHGFRKAKNSRHLTDDARSRSSAEVSDRSDINSGLMGACFVPPQKREKRSDLDTVQEPE